MKPQTKIILIALSSLLFAVFAYTSYAEYQAVKAAHQVDVYLDKMEKDLYINAETVMKANQALSEQQQAQMLKELNEQQQQQRETIDNSENPSKALKKVNQYADRTQNLADKMQKIAQKPTEKITPQDQQEMDKITKEIEQMPIDELSAEIQKELSEQMKVIK